MFDTAPTNRHSLVTMTAPEVREIGETDGSILIVPIGSVEQHGRHLPVGTDTMLVSAVTEAGVDRAEDVPIATAPPIWSGYSPHHLPFGGTLSLSFEHALHAIEDVVTSGLTNGFDAALLVNGHGGNTALVDASVSELGIAHPDAELTGLTYFTLAKPFIDDIRESEPGGMAHGGEFETSLMLHLHPELVGDDRVATPLEEPYELGDDDLLEGGPLSVYRSFDEYTASGAIGDPTLATAEKGATLLERLGDELGALLRSIHEQNR